MSSKKGSEKVIRRREPPAKTPGEFIEAMNKPDTPGEQVGEAEQLAELLEAAHDWEELKDSSEPQPQARAHYEDEPSPRRGRVGRRPLPDPLANITLNLFQDQADVLQTLAAHETLRLRRKVQSSEIVRELLRFALTYVHNNEVLDGALEKAAHSMEEAEI